MSGAGRLHALLVAAALPVSACGVIGLAGDVNGPDTLAGKSPQTLIRMAAASVRTGHYSFSASGSQTSATTGLAGFTPEVHDLFNSSGRWISNGTVAGENRLSVEAHFVDGGVLHADEIGCDGYASRDGVLWTRGEAERSLARRLAPELDDAMVEGTVWADLGATSFGSAPVHHLQAPATARTVTGAAATDEATGTGLTFAPSTIDVWIRSADGSVAAITMHTDVTADFARSPMALQAGVAGALHSVSDIDAQLRPSTLSVTAPIATLTVDPVPASVRMAMGPFSAHTDACATKQT